MLKNRGEHRYDNVEIVTRVFIRVDVGINNYHYLYMYEGCLILDETLIEGDRVSI